MRNGSRFLIICMLLACSRGTTPVSEPAPQPRTPVSGPAAAPTPADAARRVISVRKNSPEDMNAVSEYCIIDAQDPARGTIHQGLPYRFEGVNVHFPSGTAEELVERSPALLVTMVKRENLAAVLTATGRSCRPEEITHAQARSDWGTPECGQGLPCSRTLDALAKFSYWEVLTVEPFAGLVVVPDEDGGPVNVQITNIFTSKQEPMELVAHYEGGPGKLMPRFVKYPIDALDPGQGQGLFVPRTIDADGKAVGLPASRRGRHFELESLDLKGKLQAGAVEIPVQVSFSVYRLPKN